MKSVYSENPIVNVDRGGIGDKDFSSEPKCHEQENSWRGSVEYRRSEYDKKENGDKQDELTMSTKMDKVEKPTEKTDQT